MSEFTIGDFHELFRRMDHTPPKRHPLVMGFKQAIMYNTSLRLVGVKMKCFWTDTRRAYDYAEITPYNKGNLWKIRCFYDGHYDVYHGTIKKAYCTTIQDVINFINIKP